ncbi:MAG: IS4 family transposase [Rhodospirillales bacterium]|nr:IS4 family transposase [Rhodospirillales bacterium]
MHERLVALGGRRARVRRLGGGRAGEMQITRFLHNRRVSVAEMVATAATRTAGRLVGRHVLAIQDTTSVRERADEGRSVMLHPTIAVDGETGALLGLIHADVLVRSHGRRQTRKQRAFTDKQSRRWLDATCAAARLCEAGAAASVTVIADREGDIYEEFALRPAGVDLVIRAAQDRKLADDTLLFAATAALPEGGRLNIEVPAAPGRAARRATLALRWRVVAIACPQNRPAAAGLPEAVTLTLVEAREVDPPADVPPLHWRLLTTRAVTKRAEACAILELYRQRWTIEQLFRVLKTKGFDIEASRIVDGGPFEKFATAALIAAVTVQQLVRDRDGTAARPLDDALDPADRPVLEAVCATLEGKTQKQKNPHPPGSLAFAAWVFARLGGWTGYYGKPGPVVILEGLIRFHDIKQGYALP